MKKYLFLIVIFLSVSGTFAIQKPSRALADHCICCCPTCSGLIASCSGGCGCTSTQQTEADITHITNEFTYHREWLTRIVWESHLLPAMLKMTEQLTTTAVTQTASIGMLFDAKHQLESQRLLQVMQADIHKAYQPSEGLCEIGTNTRALAASEQNKKFAEIALSSYAITRNLLSGDAISGNGESSDRASRWASVRSTYCNPADNSGGFSNLCSGSDTARFNKDISYTNTIDTPYTIDDTNFDGAAAASANEQDLISLQSNLYGHKIIPRFNDLYFMAAQNGDMVDDGAFLYMDMRSLIAQRQVAMASFQAIAAAKAAGEDSVQPYMRALYTEMGLTEAQANELLGPRPSYYAQMELLTKKLYQNPNFYTNLYDKPANVDRKFVAMQAIGLMQKRDSFESLLRSEMSQSLWLELATEELQQKYENDSMSRGNRGNGGNLYIREVIEALQ